MKTIVTIILLALILPFAAHSSDHFDYKAIDSAELFFTKLSVKNYSEAWSLLTEKSKKTIINDVVKSINKQTGNNAVTFDAVSADFAQCGVYCNAYWNGFLKMFSTDDVMNNSTWSAGDFSDKYCEINIQYKDSDRPAVFKMYIEQGSWKLGLVESIWLLKRYMNQ